MTYLTSLSLIAATQEWVSFTSISSLNKEGMVPIERNLAFNLGEQMTQGIIWTLHLLNAC